MNDPLQSQMLMQDMLEFLICRRIVHKTSALDPTVAPFYAQTRDIKPQVTDANKTVTQLTHKQDH